MKKIKIYIGFLLLTCAVACTKNFEEINTNPNAPIDVQPSLLLRHVLFDYQENMHFEGFVAGNLLSQHFAEIDFNAFDRHDLTAPQFGGNPWPILYKNLRDNELVLNKATSNATFAVYEGPSLILKAYLAAALTDIYGDVPYFEALSGRNGVLTPKYDSQQAIYTATEGILENLDKGISVLKNYTGATALEGDILFNGDLNSWINFGNSLKVKYLMRISNKLDDNGQLQTIYNEGNYINSNTQNAVWDFTSSQPNNFRISTARVGDYNNFIMSETAEEIFAEYNDPRVGVFFKPTESSGDFNGLLNGPDPSQLVDFSLSDYSLAGAIFRDTPELLQANFMTAWETNFLFAEAAQKGLITADAQTIYNLAVTQAFEYWKTKLPVDYLNSGAASYASTGTDPLEQIATQKWMASIVNGYEGWIEFRRTGFPTLKTVSASLNNDLIPLRMPYPTEEEALNSANFSIASAATNGNNVNIATWQND